MTQDFSHPSREKTFKMNAFGAEEWARLHEPVNNVDETSDESPGELTGITVTVTVTLTPRGSVQAIVITINNSS